MCVCACGCVLAHGRRGGAIRGLRRVSASPPLTSGSGHQYGSLSCQQKQVNLGTVNHFLIFGESIHSTQVGCVQKSLYAFLTYTLTSASLCFEQKVFAPLWFGSSDTSALQAADRQQAASVAENPWPCTLTFTLNAVPPLLICCHANLILAPSSPALSAVTFRRLGRASFSHFSYYGHDKTHDKFGRDGVCRQVHSI